MRALLVVSLLLIGSPVYAQQIPAPTAPVVFCGQQAAPEASSYALVFDGAASEPLTMDATVDAGCPAGSTHSFRIAAAKFTLGAHTVQVKSINAFGSTDGVVYDVTVGIAPGRFTITAVIRG